MNPPEKIKAPLTFQSFKIVPQHVNGSCHIHVDVYVTSLPFDIHGQMRVCSAYKQWLVTMGNAGLGTTDLE